MNFVNELKLRQFKLTNGDEIVCEIMEDLELDLVIRFALRLTTVSSEDNKIYYIFKPFMIYQTNQNNVITLNTSHIMGAAIPDDDLLPQYFSAVDMLKRDTSDRKVEEETDALFDELFSRLDSDQNQYRNSLH